jgi:hypothetical protein
MINTTKKRLTIAAITAAALLMSSTIAAIAVPAFASSSSRKEFRHDVRDFLDCVHDDHGSKISRSNFVDCLTDNFNIHISSHTEKHL